jgi:DNA methylase
VGGRHHPLLDLTDCSDIVVDPFLGSGSTLIAADKTGRVCRGVELDPLYVDVIVRRFEAATGNQAVLVQTGDTFEALATQGAGTGVALRPAPAVAEAASGLDVSVKAQVLSPIYPLGHRPGPSTYDEVTPGHFVLREN